MSTTILSITYYTMKKLVTYFSLLLALILPAESFSQLVLTAETGTSFFGLHHSARASAEKGATIRAYRLGLEKKFKSKNLLFGCGLMVNSVGSEHIFVGRWRTVYSGISLGVQYPMRYITVGIRTTPSISVASSISIGFDHKAFYNIDIEPNLGIDFTQRIQLTCAASFGLNPAINVGPDLAYTNVAYLVGMNFCFSRKK